MSDPKDKIIDFFPDTVRDFYSYLEQHPSDFLRIPRLRGMLARHRYEQMKGGNLKTVREAGSDRVRAGTVDHNAANLDAMADYDRGAELVQLIGALSYAAERAEEMKVLSIGPRTETEILGLIGFGFSPPNIDAIDLISYSPYVHAGDMHDMPFADNSYDVVIAGWVLAYSKDPHHAAKEIVRAAKHGALIVVGCDRSDDKVETWLNPETSRTSQVTDGQTYPYASTQDILALFGDAVGEVVHRQEARPPFTHLTRRIISAFHLSKPSDPMHKVRDLMGAEMLATQSMRRLVEANDQLDDETFGDVMALLDAHSVFCQSGVNSQSNHMALRRLCAQSRGTIDGAFHLQICQLFPPLLSNSYEDFTSSLGQVGSSTLDVVVASIKEDGLTTGPFRAPDSIIEEINTGLDELPVVDRNGVEYSSLSKVDKGVGRVICRTRDIRKLPAVMQLATDPVLIALAERYLGCQPIVENLSAMVSWPGSETDLDSLALNAQLFHYDKDRLRFLKVFVFLSDIGPENGPHAYVRKSHTMRPDALWQQRRFTDEELTAEVSKDLITEVCGPAGTILAADTMGLHKGVPVRAGTRRVLQIQYSNSLFGAPTDPADWIAPEDVPDADHLAEYPRVSMAAHFREAP